MDTPRIYVASLTDYNAGVLHGAWIDATQGVEGMEDDIAAMLAESPTARAEGGKAEEWAIHDYDGFQGVKLNEYDNLETVNSIVTALQEWPAPVVRYLFHGGYDAGEIDMKLKDLYLGQWDGLEEEDAIADFHMEHLNDRKDIPEDFVPHLRAVARSMARDSINGGDIEAVRGDEAFTWHLLSADR